jgi:hypothetical protein
LFANYSEFIILHLVRRSTHVLYCNTIL